MQHILTVKPQWLETCNATHLQSKATMAGYHQCKTSSLQSHNGWIPTMQNIFTLKPQWLDTNNAKHLHCKATMAGNEQCKTSWLQSHNGFKRNTCNGLISSAFLALSPVLCNWSMVASRKFSCLQCELNCIRISALGPFFFAMLFFEKHSDFDTSPA